jgi:hypothetical protein
MKALILTFALIGFSGAVYAEETMSEKAAATADNAARAIKKGAHRTQEAVCAKGDAKCLAEKARNRGTEAADYTKDKTKEVKNKIDNDTDTK